MIPNGMLAIEKWLSAGMESQDLRGAGAGAGAGAMVQDLQLLRWMERWECFVRSCRIASGFRRLSSIERFDPKTFQRLELCCLLLSGKSLAG